MSVDMKDYLAYQEGYEAGKRDAAPRWVRCEERLPDDTFKQVLITDGTHFGLAYCLDLGVYGVKWRKTNWMSIGGLFRGKITHWMPIEPPKEDA